MAVLLLIRPEPQSRALLAALAARGVTARAVVSPVVRVERREIPDTEFTLPAGFAAVPLLEVFGRAAP